jgi:hypothetical protein
MLQKAFKEEINYFNNLWSSELLEFKKSFFATNIKD